MGWSVYVPTNGNFFGQSSLFAIKIFLFAQQLLPAEPDEAA